MLAWAKPIAGFASTGHARRERLDKLRAEAIARLRAYSEHPSADLIPRYLLYFSPAQKPVDGDRKTSIGVYQVTSQIPGSKLPALYGWGAHGNQCSSAG